MQSYKKNDPAGSFIRWQSITIGQLAYASNLMLTLAVATLGYEASILLSDRFSGLPCTAKSTFLVGIAALFLLVISSLGLLVSIGVALFLVINRLRDFRETKTAARMREQNKPDEAIEPHRVIYRKLGRRSWVLFWNQIALFGISIVFAVFGVFLTAAYGVLR
ncbi:hypothetical protein FHS83_002129 [Rhizomicrobium palustre]|uniref:Uncharacterized protein n=1 Tax=Rhizomicrobium palustre TaxID=189966 RepID=A0A846N0D1_9PROT|nr:hypothetical protein [Rhizomicrobium palustre]NIK88811.1 hypothetical protein [Rhizomicrobium palustre]